MIQNVFTATDEKQKSKQQQQQEVWNDLGRIC